jgi:MipA family protein
MPVNSNAIRLSFTGLALAVASFSAAAIAQDATDSNQLTIGVGAGIVPSYEGSDDSVIVPGALVRGKVAGFSFFTRGTYAYVDAIPEKGANGWDFELGPVGGVRLNRTRQIKDDRVRALGKLDTAWEVGGWAGIAKTGVITSAYDNLSVRVSYLHDVAGAHGSYVITPAIEYGTPLSQSTYIGLSLSANYVGKGYGRTYFNVSSQGSLDSGLSPYSAGGRKAGFSRVDAGILAAKSLTGDLRKGASIFAIGGYGRLLGRYADSPIVREAGSRDQWMGGLGVAYTF